MSMRLARAWRVLVPNDLRLVWRDTFLLLMLVVLPLAGLGMRWLLPYVAEVVSPWLDLEPYYGLMLGFFLIGQQPILLGAVVGILFVEERDEGTLLALQASPLSLRGFLLYRVLFSMGLSVVLTVVGVSLAGLVPVSPRVLLAAALAASLTVPMVALGYAVYIQNKVQAITAIKLVQSWAALPALLYFVATPWQWIGSVPAPLYFPIRLFWSAAEDHAEWWLMGPGVMLPAVGILLLVRRFERTVYA
jgi:fluoroquinolone transport system permease protein